MDREAYFRNMLLPEEYNCIKKYDTLCEMLADCQERFSERPAVLWNGGEKTYSELSCDVATTRGYLAGLNLPHGHVGVLCYNDYDFLRICLAAATLGKVAVLLPCALPQQAVAGAVQKYDIDHLIYSPGLLSSVPQGVPSTPADKALSAPLPMAEVQKHDPAVIIFSGGTTGRPKGALLSHGALLRGAYNGSLAYERVLYQRYLSLIPLTHVFGLVRNLLTAFVTGSSVYMCPNMKEIGMALAKARPTVLVLVPALADMLYKLAKVNGTGMLGGALEVIICGGAAVPPRLITNFDALGVHVLPGYGLTETSNLVSGNGEPLKYPDSVGVPYPEQELKIVDGELWVKGDHLMSGYYNDPQETAAAMQDGFFKTGDLARLDESGYLYIVGRSKNIIVRASGENVSPEELEALVNALPFVQDCLVYEKKDILTVELLAEPGAVKALGITDVFAAAQQGVEGINKHLPDHMKLQKVILRSEDFPRSPSMKIIRPKAEELV